MGVMRHRRHRRRRRRRCAPALTTAAAFAALAVFTALQPAAAATACANASALVAGAAPDEAVAYDAECRPRVLRVSESGGMRALNASKLALVALKGGLPHLHTLDASANALESLALGADMDLARLELRGNHITDLSLSTFPPRLTYLDLRQNRISTLTERGPWTLQPAVLQTLLLDENPVAVVEAAALAPLRSLQYLSLVKTALTSLNSIQLPPSLSVLNASSNGMDSLASNFSNLPASIQYLDLSKNKLSELPSRISDLEALVELNLASNQITRIEGVRFATTLKKLNLDGNAIEMIEICRPDVSVLAGVELTLPTFKLTACAKSSAALELVNGTPMCVVEDCSKQGIGEAAGAGTGSTVVPTGAPAPTTTTTPDTSVLNNNSSGSASSAFSSKSIVVIGGISFFLGVLASAFGFLLYRKRSLGGNGKRKVTGNYLPFGGPEARGGGIDRDLDEKSDANWVFGEPQVFPNAVALLEEDEDAKRKKPGLLDDLLVYEIPPEEIRIKGDLHPGSGNSGGGSRHHQQMTTTATTTQSAMFLAEYQGYQVVLRALLLQKKSQRRREERRFIEQIRLASTLEHPSIVQFIGLTFGSSSHQHQPMAAQRWKFAVVFEFMHRGSLAAMFQNERGRREGKLYYRKGETSSGSSGGGGGGNLFSWFPSSSSQSNAQNPESDWRCKLSIALDVAMGLVYLHANQVVHGSLSSSTVLVNDNGEAKLSALDVKLPGDLDVLPREGSIRQSARMKMKKMIAFKPSSFSQSQLGSSFMHGGGGGSGATAPPTPSVSLDPSSPTFRETKGDIYAFGLLLWELDTILSVDMVKDLSSTTVPGEEHKHLRFTDECPSEIQSLARRCWSTDIHQRPDALELQEELVQLLEGRITTSSRAVSSWLRTTNLSMIGSFSSSKLSSSSSLSSASVYRYSEFEADV